MNRIRRTFLTAAAVAALAFPASASATLSPLYTGWAAGPASLLFTEADRTAWSAVADDVAAERFVRLFWLRRDPTPDTPDNEFRRDFERRVAMANQSFSETLDDQVTPGWKSDRGRTFVLLGPPERRQKSGSEGEASGGDTGISAGGGGISSGGGPGLFGTGGGQDRFGGAAEETWIYEDENKPAWIKKRRVTVKFRSQPGKPHVTLHNSEEALALMAEARTRAVVAPDLDESALATKPAGGGIGGGVRLFGARALPSDARLDALREAAKGVTSPLGALAAGAFQASDGSWLVSVHLAAASAPFAGSTAIVELANADGTTLIAFEPTGAWKDGPGQSYLQASVAPPSGMYEVRAGVRDATGAMLWAANRKVEVPASADGFWLSEIVLSEQIAPMERAQDPLQPYAWQGIAVLPNPTGTFPQGGLLWVYLHACQPELDAGGRPQIQAQIEVSGTAQFRGAVRGEPVKASDRCWVVAQAFDLPPGAFPPGDYRLDVKASSGGAAALTRSATFRVVEGR